MLQHLVALAAVQVGQISLLDILVAVPLALILQQRPSMMLSTQHPRQCRV